MPKKEDVILQALTNMNEKMDRHYESTNSRLTSIEKVQVKQEENLGEHMRRTDLVEEGVKLLAQDLIATKKNEIEPLTKHKAFIEGVLKGVGLIVTLASFAAAIVKIITFFHH